MKRGHQVLFLALLHDFFPHRLFQRQGLHDRLDVLAPAERGAAAAALDDRLAARRVTVKVRYADFSTVTSARTLAEPTDRDDDFFEAAAGKLEELLQKRRMQVRLIGVTLSALGPAGERQGKLFDEGKPQRRRRFYEGLDKLREKFGHDIARVGPSLRLPREDQAEEPKKKEKKDVREGIR